jgi:hypothetical protein
MKKTLDIFEWKIIKKWINGKSIQHLTTKKGFVWKQNNKIVTTVAMTKTANAEL